MEVKVIEGENEVYQKDKLLGQGAFGKAYLVRKRQTGELLVIKEVSIDHMSPKEREETIKQAQILRNCNHPLIVKFVEVYATKQNKLKIVMEYAEAGDLSKAIQTKKKSGRLFEENQILDWFTQICLAMKHVHDRKILHRDIKGQNIFITKANTLKLGDFGIARVLNKTQDKARTVVGTPYYLSPQIIENKPYSFKSDIWSMGVLLYQLCALAPPFNATSLQFLALKIVKGSYTSLPATFSPQLRGLVTEILQVDPNKRPSVGEILKKPFLQDRIRKFLSETYRNDEFSHTVLHNQNIHIKNKLVKVDHSSKERDPRSIEKERLQLKEEAAALKAQRDRQKEEQRRRQEQRLKQRREEEAEKARKAEMERARLAEQRRQAKKEADKERAAQERRAWIEREKKKQEQMNRRHEQDERKRVLQIADMARRRQKQEQQAYSRRQQLMAEQAKMERHREAPGRKNSSRAREQDKKRQEYAQLARQQWYENQMIRKRAQERAKQSQSDYSSQPSYQQEQEPVRKQSREKPASKINDKRSSLPAPPSQEQLQNAMMNPNFNPKGRAPIPSAKVKPSSSKAIVPDREQQDKRQKKDYSSGMRQQMRKDRQQFLKHKQGSPKEQPVEIVETLKPGKWNRRPSSRDKSTGNPNSRRNSEQEVVKDSPQQRKRETTGADSGSEKGSQDGLALNVKDKQQFNDYLAQLEGLLGNVQKNIDKIQGVAAQPEVLPEIPVVEEQIMVRDDDNQQLDYSMTGSFQPVVEPPVNEQDADFDYFSDYSKLQELRMNLQEKFGTENFIKIYRALENELQSKGLAQFDIIEVVTNLDGIDVKLVTGNLPLLLTVIVMEEKMMGV